MKTKRNTAMRTSFWAVVLVSLVSTLRLEGHEWHRPHEAGVPVESDVFAIPAAEGSEPIDSAAVAHKAAAFAPFAPGVRTRWDSQWFYIESTGIPLHDMMTGITAWQQQVGVPQYYFGSNAWQIPINPQPAGAPTPVSTSNLLRGAVAIAINGIPIFNLYNNRGENTLNIGELDNWDGHCGRADDYHYHIVPYHLNAVVGDAAPLAYALDGYPIYGSTEADGSAQTLALDSSQGHTHGTNGYHYHALASADYSIRGLYGVVTTSGAGPENQINPQSRTSEFRPALTPLNGAEITAFTRVSEQTFSLVYQRSGQNHTVNWSVDPDAGSVTYQFINPGGTSSNTYNTWQATPGWSVPTLGMTNQGLGVFRFEATGTPGTALPFSWSSDLAKWIPFGFHLLDGSGHATFVLEARHTNGFLRAE